MPDNYQSIGNESSYNQQAGIINNVVGKKEKTLSILGKILQSLINNLNGKSDFQNRYEKEFKFQEKISFNNLIVYSDTIQDWLEYMFYIDSIYEIEKQNNQFAYKSLQSTIKRLYKKELEIVASNQTDKMQIIRENSDKIFGNIFNKLSQIVENDKLLENIESEYIESGLEIILVKAFIDCNILENPNVSG